MLIYILECAQFWQSNGEQASLEMLFYGRNFKYQN